MINEPRTYRRPPIQIILVIVLLGVFSIGLLTTTFQIGYIFLIPFVLFLGIIFLTVLYLMTQKTFLSDDGISTQTILGGKSLRWSEINRVSGRGHALKLHNFDGYVTVAPSPQLPGYEEVVEWIGIKRPDLFNPLEYAEMAKNWMSTIYLPLMGVFVIGMGFIVLTQSNDAFVSFIIFFMIGVVIIGSAFAMPQSLTLDGKSLLIKYPLNQKTLLADDIQSVELKNQSTRNGKNYFILINLVNKKGIRIAGLNPNLPVNYLVLKNWHKKNSTIGLTTQQN
jgi:hypothetical protein